MSIIGVVCDDKATAFRILLLVSNLMFRRRLHRQHPLLVGLQRRGYVAEIERLLWLVGLSRVHEVAGLVVCAGARDAWASRGVEACGCWQAASVISVVVVLLLLLVEEVVSEAYSPSRVGVSPLELATLRPGVGTCSCRRWQNNHCVPRVAIHASPVEHAPVILSPKHRWSGLWRLRPVILMLATMMSGPVVLLMLLLLVVLLLGGSWETGTAGTLLLPPVEDVGVQTSPI